MYKLIQSGSITEMDMGKDMAFIFKDGTLFDSTGYKFLLAQNNENFVRCAKVQYNGKMKFVYLTSYYTSLLTRLPALGREGFVQILANLLNIILEVKDNGYLNEQNLFVSFDKIFIDVSSAALRLIYLPINRLSSETGDLSFENGLRGNLIHAIRLMPVDRQRDLRFIEAELRNSKLNLLQLYNIMRGEIKETAPVVSFDGKQPPMTLLSINSASQIEFFIDKAEFIIGTDGEKVDGVIPFNNAVSMVHCKVVFAGGQYWLYDIGKNFVGSTNGTFINGKKLVPPNRPFPIHKNDVLKFANVEFAIKF